MLRVDPSAAPQSLTNQRKTNKHRKLESLQHHFQMVVCQILGKIFVKVQSLETE